MPVGDLFIRVLAPPLRDDVGCVGDAGGEDERLASALDPGLVRRRDHPGVGDHDLWVPNWSSASCDLGVFMYQPAEQIATSQVKLGRRCRRW